MGALDNVIAPDSVISSGTVISTVEELVDLVGTPQPATRDKVQACLDDADRDFLAASPLCFVATRGAAGGDVSPKGDPPGFVKVLSPTTIVVPERAGNKRVDGFRNILEDNRVALIFIVPGTGYTLRINGRATLVTDGPYFDDLIVRGHRPQLAMVVDIDEVFNHCPKAFIRSHAWDPQTWDTSGVLAYAELAKRKWRAHDSPDEVDAHYAPAAYEKGLYPATHAT